MTNPSAVLMVRPNFFAVNAETAGDNAFQRAGMPEDQALAVAEFDAFAGQLSRAGVKVTAFEQQSAATPDAVFPNNWFSTHPDGTLVVYPMMAPSRRGERREDILRTLADRYEVTRRIDLSAHENEGAFLEGTGSLVFDHRARLAWLAVSRRSDPGLARELCEELGYELMTFGAEDRSGRPIYHTNVILSVGRHLALVGAGNVPDPNERGRLLDSLDDGGRSVVELSPPQIEAFAGNALELTGAGGVLLAMSETGAATLTSRQRGLAEERAALVTPSLPTIEKSGGSARCMLAGIHFTERTAAS
jgi:hypothetical protein